LKLKQKQNRDNQLSLSMNRLSVRVVLAYHPSMDGRESGQQPSRSRCVSQQARRWNNLSAIPTRPGAELTRLSVPGRPSTARAHADRC